MKTTIISFIVIWSSFTFGDSNICKNVFSIPIYPGMYSVHGEPSPNILPPFITCLKVLKTKDGVAVDTESVISFYKKYYTDLGWKKGVAERRGEEPYLSMMVHLHDNSSLDVSYMQVSGDLSLWVAPNDGLVTIYMHQWRNSCLSNDLHGQLKQTENKLKQAAKDLKYTFGAANLNMPFSSRTALEFYQNEMLVGYKVFSLRREGQRLKATFLSFKNDLIAQKQAAMLMRESAEKTYEMKQKFRSYYNRSVIQMGFLVVLLENRDQSQTNIVSKLIQKIEE